MEVTLDRSPILIPKITAQVHYFLKLTGYGPSDILSLSYSTGIFLTRNGGKYRLEDNRIIHMAGPDPDPSQRL